jgi:hypothetical protein
MDKKKALTGAGIAIGIVLTAAMAFFLIAYFAGWDRLSPLQYYEADRAEPSAAGHFRVPVDTLTEEDVQDHPILSDLLIDREKLLYSLKPGQVIPVLQQHANHYTCGGKGYHWRILSDQENAYLTQFDMHVVSFRGQYYYVRKEGARPIMPCGNGTQC